MPQEVTYTIDEAADLTHFEPSVISTATTLAIVNGSLILCDMTSGAYAVSLPIASNNKNRVITVKKTSADANVLTIDTIDAALIDGAASTTITTQWDKIQFQSDGTDWYIIGT